MKTKYEYNCTIVHVHDGDTFTADIDLGFGVILKKQKIRLYGLNTPEIVGEQRAEGLKATAYVKEYLTPGSQHLIETFKDKTEKYGRYLARVYIESDNGDFCLNDMLVFKKLAKPYFGEGEK